jgi:exopolysaccharide biosynthesis polyprenyl glycosylphosphotransferase
MTVPEQTAAPRRLKPSDIQSVRVRLCVLVLVCDCAALLIGCIVGNMVRYDDPLAAAGLHFFALVLPIFLGVAIINDAYAPDVLGNVRTGFTRALLAYMFAIFVVFFLAFYMNANGEMSRINSAVAICVSVVALWLARTLCKIYTRRVTGMQLLYELLIVDGVAITAPAHVHVLDTERDNLQPNLQDPHMLNRLGMQLKGVDRVVIACPPERRQIWSMLLKGSSVNGYIVAEELDDIGAIGIGLFAGQHTLAVAHAPLDLSRRAAKRVLDLAFTLPGLIFLAPLLIAVAIAIKLDSRGPVFFLQPRVGRGNRIFLTYKFRSMRAELSDAAGNRSTARDDKRITRVGKFIRATSIDELPQLFNVLRGEMSLVGPRPHALGSLAGNELFWEVDERYWHRHASKPGLTGLAQVRGYRGATPEREDLANRLNADLEYLNGWTIWRDLSILINTLKVLVHRNAY